MQLRSFGIWILQILYLRLVKRETNSVNVAENENVDTEEIQEKQQKLEMSFSHKEMLDSFSKNKIVKRT